jgi:tRNA-specific 2-thiouridylase
MRVLLGMSGGVDSSTAAVILKRDGHEVEGLSLRLFESRGRTGQSACCSLMAMEDAKRAAETAGIPHRTLNARDLFIRTVVEPFSEAYSRGLTPNPCVLCNRHVKFPLLIEEARKSGFSHIATGHYAIVDRSGGQALLKKSIDPKKDQSYFLYPIGRRTLEKAMFPLGGYNKEDVRSMARHAGLDMAGRPESQEICFVENDDYASTVLALMPEAARQGPIIGPEGKVIGEHKGAFNFTLGQRKGLGISWPHPLYVISIDTDTNTVHVGPREKTMRREFHVDDLVWLVGEARGKDTFRAEVKVRSTMSARPANITPMGNGRVHVEYDEPEFAPAPGQSAVFYDGDIVIGGGTIQK